MLKFKGKKMTQKTVLCYGDSNTWGYVPNADYSLPIARYSRSERWPGIIQALLGNDYYVVEEGLNSRTTNVDYAPPPNRNGKTYLAPCLYSHAPIDLIILALGGNDTKIYFDRTPEQIKNGLAELVDIIQSSNYGALLQSAPKILITTPAIPLPFIENYIDENGIQFLKGAVSKIESLVNLYADLAAKKGCYYLNLSNIKPSEIDGVHYDKDAHHKCAEMISNKIIEIFE